MGIDKRMKEYENQEVQRYFSSPLPVCVRIDGKNFSSFTRRLGKPYDKRLSNLMIATMVYLVKETNAIVGYTQSDEISLIWRNDTEGQMLFKGRIQKITSILASMTTAYFNSRLCEYIEEKADQVALFDSRAWQVPSLEEAVNVLLWREFDAIKNSISMAAQSEFSHKKLHKKSGEEKCKMLLEKGINWEEYPSFFKRGTYALRKKVIRRFTTEEIENLPAKHEARTNPNLVVGRTDVGVVEVPPLLKVKNRVGFLFEGQEIELAKL